MIMVQRRRAFTLVALDKAAANSAIDAKRPSIDLLMACLTMSSRGDPARAG